MYETLQYPKTPLRQSRGQGAGEANDNYETLQMGPVGKWRAGHGAQQHKEHQWNMQPLLLVLLAAFLVLLATSIALGVRYWQVITALLQSQEQLAKTRGGGSHCQKELHSRSMELQKAEAGLKQAQVKLSQARQEGNSCQRFLHWRDMDLQEARAALQQAQEQLLWLQKQAQLLSQQLKESAGAQASAFPCKATDCCPETWVLHRGKCLFLSKEKKTWKDSKKWCEQESSKLLITWDWDRTAMLTFLTNTDTSYWIGLCFDQRWIWIDETPYAQ
ncbi:B-cell differentiation antigen CD72-like [Alligator sinensis]|uniref:B-cell differentiation antigen CD72-like n=1 Tax=Alligator sinensis TaxID=38654 RepID=A0A3Q0HM36_ALLSI|nr:B-cell differentiation antigen CD72-like [Alligator sinensis]